MHSLRFWITLVIKRGAENEVTGSIRAIGGSVECYHPPRLHHHLAKSYDPFAEALPMTSPPTIRQRQRTYEVKEK